MNTPPRASGDRPSVAALKRLRSLTTKKGRASAGSFLVEGWKSVTDAYEAGWVISCLVLEHGRPLPPRGRDLVERLAGKRVAVYELPAGVLRELGETVNGQGVIAEVGGRAWTLDDVASASSTRILALDTVGDPGNVGTLIRSADWYGCGGVLLGPGTASADNDKVVRSTSGSIFHLPVVAVDDLVEALRTLRARGWIIAGTEVHRTTPASLPPPTARIVLVLGSEAHGLSEPVRSLVDHVLTIPRIGRAESLNVAVAGGILLDRLAAKPG